MEPRTLNLMPVPGRFLFLGTPGLILHQENPCSQQRPSLILMPDPDSQCSHGRASPVGFRSRRRKSGVGYRNLVSASKSRVAGSSIRDS